MLTHFLKALMLHHVLYLFPGTVRAELLVNKRLPNEDESRATIFSKKKNRKSISKSKGKPKLLILICIEFHVAVNFAKLTKNFQKFPDGPQSGRQLNLFSVSFILGLAAWGPWAQATLRMKETEKIS